jgi:DNA-binding transcriptional ArsR family regulator
MATLPPDVRAAELARLAALLADTTRAAILLALLDGRAWTAGELAAHASHSSTATEHLNRLLAAAFWRSAAGAGTATWSSPTGRRRCSRI